MLLLLRHFEGFSLEKDVALYSRWVSSRRHPNRRIWGHCMNALCFNQTRTDGLKGVSWTSRGCPPKGARQFQSSRPSRLPKGWRWPSRRNGGGACGEKNHERLVPAEHIKRPCQTSLQRSWKRDRARQAVPYRNYNCWKQIYDNPFVIDD